MSNEQSDKLFDSLGLTRLALKAKVFFTEGMPAAAGVVIGLSDAGVYFTPSREADKGNIWFVPWARVAMVVYENT